MKKPKWGTGGVVYRRYTLDPDTKEQIKTELMKAQLPATTAFMTAIESCASAYLASKELDDQRANKQQVNAALQQISKASEKLATMLHNVDDLTRAVIRTRQRNTVLPNLPIADLEKYVTTLACLCADKSKIKSKIKTARLFFCTSMAKVFGHNLKVKPTTTRGGLFENICIEILTDVEGAEVQDIHDSVVVALTGRRMSL